MNRLKHAAIRYLLQHQSDPVDWWKGSEEAFAQAHASDRPVLLPVGYTACRWYHVMAHESFENPAIAAVMNELLVNIKTDHNKRPDTYHICMADPPNVRVGSSSSMAFVSLPNPCRTAIAWPILIEPVNGTTSAWRSDEARILIGTTAKLT